VGTVCGYLLLVAVARHAQLPADGARRVFGVVHMDGVKLRVLHDRLDQGLAHRGAPAGEATRRRTQGDHDRAGHTGGADVDVGSVRRCNIGDGQLPADGALAVMERDDRELRAIGVARAGDLLCP
jgi:hypothetical protein